MRISVVIMIVLVALFLFFGLAKIGEKTAACEKPIVYTVGVLDRRFGISQKEFLSAMAEAETIWEKPLGKELFVYKPENAELSVNLIYDYRQEATKTLSSLENVVKEDESSYQTLQSRYKALKAAYASAKSNYELEVKSFNENNSAYEAKVEAWNNSKRNSKEHFDELERDKLALETELGELKILETRLNKMVEEINILVGKLNYLAKSLNLKVDTYNTIGASRGESFTGGVYSSGEGEEEINIYEFSNRDKLVRTIAHELGHALGLEHVDDPEAVMYYLNESNKRVLSKSDLRVLRTLCRVE